MSSQGEYYGVEQFGNEWVAMYDIEQHLMGTHFATEKEAQDFVDADMRRANTIPKSELAPVSTSKDELDINIPDDLDQIMNYIGDQAKGYRNNEWEGTVKIGKRIQAYVATEVLKELRDFAGFEDDDWTGNVEIPQQRLMERIRFWEGKK